MSYMTDLGAMAPLAPMAAKVAPKMGMRTQPVMKLTAALKPAAEMHAGMGGSTKILLLGGAAAAIWFLFLRKKPGSGPIVGKTIAVRSLAQEGI